MDLDKENNKSERTLWAEKPLKGHVCEVESKMEHRRNDFLAEFG